MRCRARLLGLAALAALLFTVTAVVQDSLIHTDDGCAVEIHCIACRWALSSGAVLAYVPTVTPSVERAESLRRAPIVLVAARVRDVPESRGPPV